jgi:hypothetical protein
VEAEENLEILLLQIESQKKDHKELYQLPKKMSSYSKELAEPPSSKYVVKLEHIVLSAEEKWLKMIQKNKPILFLQKLPTQRMSKNALEDD